MATLSLRESHPAPPPHPVPLPRRLPDDSHHTSYRDVLASQQAASALFGAAHRPDVTVVQDFEATKGDPRPQYRLLAPETDLNADKFGGAGFELGVSPSAAELSADGTLAMQQHHQELSSSCLAGFVTGDDVDVIAPVENMKKFFRMPYSSERVSMAVHRVGRTLVLDGTIAAASDPSVEQETAIKKKKRRHRKKLHTEFLRQSRALSSEGSNDNGTLGLPDANAVLQCLRSEADQSGNEDDGGEEGGENEEDNNTQGTDDTLPVAPRPFTRVNRAQFQDLTAILGSELSVFKHGDHSAVALALADLEGGEAELSLQLLDSWLDNVMANVPEVALCWHKAGLVQSYQLMKTEQLPARCSRFWTPDGAEGHAVKVLRWLLQECTREATTYWLFKEECGDELQLFNLHDVRRTLADARQSRRSEDVEEDPHSEPMPDPAEDDSGITYNLGPFAYPVAMLCYRIASKLPRDDPAHRPRRRELFAKCAALVDPAQLGTIVATAREQVAETFLCVHTHTLPSVPCPSCCNPMVAGVEAYSTASSDSTAPFVLASSSKRDDCFHCLRQLQMGIEALTVAGATRLPLFERLRRKAAQCHHFLASVHLASRKPGALSVAKEQLQLAFTRLVSSAPKLSPGREGYEEEQANLVEDVRLRGTLLVLAGDLYNQPRFRLTRPIQADHVAHLDEDDRAGRSPSPDLDDSADCGDDDWGVAWQDGAGEEEDGVELLSVDSALEGLRLVDPLTIKPARRLELAAYHYALALPHCDPPRRVEALRRLGDTSNELAKLRLAQGRLADAEAAFERGAQAFREVHDVANHALLLCNRASLCARRALEEDRPCPPPVYHTPTAVAPPPAAPPARDGDGGDLLFPGDAEAVEEQLGADADAASATAGTHSSAAPAALAVGADLRGGGRGGSLGVGAGSAAGVLQSACAPLDNLAPTVLDVSGMPSPPSGRQGEVGLDQELLQPEGLTESQLAQLARSVELYEEARQALGARSHVPWAWDLVHQQLAATFLFIARRLSSGTAPAGVGGARDPNLVPDLLRKALAIHQMCGDVQQQAVVLQLLAAATRDGGSRREALGILHKALKAAADANSLSLVVRIRLDLATMLRGEDMEEALRVLLQCHRATPNNALPAAETDVADESLWMEALTAVRGLLRDLAAKGGASAKVQRYRTLYRLALTAPAKGQVPEHLRQLEHAWISK